MGKGFYVSKLVAFVAIFTAIAAVATIIALSVVYANEKSNNNKVENGGSTSTASSTASTSKPTTPASNKPWDLYRLPKTLIPDHYDVDLRPVLEKDSRGLYVFHGKSASYFRCVTPTNLVIIHSKKLNFTKNVVLKDDTNRDIAINREQLVERTNYLVLHLAETLQSNKTYKLHTEYIGELANDLAGFYRSEYVEDNTTKLIATTQMQAHDARKAFPCFDEPAMKATFNITLRYKPNYVALSNMNSISVTSETWEGQQWQVTVFNKTPKMSTYLVAFIVSEFKSVGDDRVKIWGRKKAVEDQKQAEYALSVSKPILEFFEKYYKVPYPLLKSDQVALPDFSAGAMENWGLVTYRETALFWDQRQSSIGNKDRVVTVIAHELAHQWFGNLVTIRWWNDLWLNEGFASYVEYLGADFAEPTWNIKDLIVLYDVHRVMAVDALASSHPLTSKEDEVNSPAEISEQFDSIAYSKGASVIRMLSSFLTEELFVEGLASYLKAFQYSNTVYADLWDHLQMAVDKQNNVTLPDSVSAIMDTWVLQMGFPVVTINTATGSLDQKHFLQDPDSVVTRPSPFNYTWKVPISYLRSDGHKGNLWLQQRSGTHEEFKVYGNDWVLVNLNVTGYYRVNYDDRNWDRLLHQLNNDISAIPVINRAQIIDDAFNLARAKYVSTTRALETTTFLSKEVEYMPWAAAISSLSYFVQVFDRTEVYGPMKAYMRQQVEPLFLYFKNKTNNFTQRMPTLTEQYSEINAVSTACAFGISECRELATRQFRDWMETNVNNIHPNLRYTIYCNAIARGGEEEWNFAWQEFKKTDNAQEADKLRASLGCSKEPWILNRLLEYAVDTTKIRRQDSISTILNVAGNVVGQSLAWDFVRGHWKTFLERFGSSSFSFRYLITGVTRRFSTDFDLQQLEQFKKDNEGVGFGTASRALEQSIEKTKANLKWVNENKNLVKEWLTLKVQ
ncbi:PREDICTED: aminopeptidase N-like [Nanorana parkeri]|uniref:aminopeptidase N-like n=1 Tax=Nanorana parkeri TaxID=125878 RepID=UPI00085416DA|nr:PREDICTED: aminopeptidase N-like [Nanorana parkeri]